MEWWRSLKSKILLIIIKKQETQEQKGYEDVEIKEGDLVLYQHQDKKAWLGAMNVFAVKGKDILIFNKGSVRKVPRWNVLLCEAEEIESKM